MGGAFFVRRATALAGDLTLLFGRHRSKTASFLANSVHSHPPGSSGNLKSIATGEPRRDRSREWPGFKADASPAEKRTVLNGCKGAVYAAGGKRARRKLTRILTVEVEMRGVSIRTAV
jgi:hypothetical protein